MGRYERHHFFDVDGTLVSKDPSTQKNFTDVRLKDIFQQMMDGEGDRFGFCTSRSRRELYSVCEELGLDGKNSLIVSVIEDGHLLWWYGNGVDETVLLSDPESGEQIREMGRIISSILDGEGWQYFPNITTPVRIPPVNEQGEVIFTLWEKGPNKHDLSYVGEYEMVEEYLRSVLNKEGFDLIDLIEIGNGTLCVVQKGIDKSSGLTSLLALRNNSFDQVVYFGDGLNDINVAKLIVAGGGVMVAVANACPELKQIASLVTSEIASMGVVEYFIMRK